MLAVLKLLVCTTFCLPSFASPTLQLALSDGGVAGDTHTVIARANEIAAVHGNLHQHVLRSHEHHIRQGLLTRAPCYNTARCLAAGEFIGHSKCRIVSRALAATRLRDFDALWGGTKSESAWVVRVAPE